MKVISIFIAITCILTGCGNNREVVTATVTPMQMTGINEDNTLSFDEFLANLNMYAAASSFIAVEPDLYALRVAVREKRWDDAKHFIGLIRQRRQGLLTPGLTLEE